MILKGKSPAMCYMNARFAGITRVVFAADRNEAAEYCFDYRGTYPLFAEVAIFMDGAFEVVTGAVLAVPKQMAPGGGRENCRNP